MADYDGLNESVVLTLKSRKRKKQCSSREKEKLFRHSSGGKIPSISCNHIKGFCKVSLLDFVSSLYLNNQRVGQYNESTDQCLHVDSVFRI